MKGGLRFSVMDSRGFVCEKHGWMAKYEKMYTVIQTAAVDYSF